MATLTAVQIYFEGETFLNYLSGEGLMFSPEPVVIGFMAYLPVILSLALLLRVFFIVKFKREVSFLSKKGCAGDKLTQGTKRCRDEEE